MWGRLAACGGLSGRLVLLLAVLGLLTAPAAEQQETTEKVFHAISGGRLTIENVIGPISVTAVSGSDVRVTVVRTIEARTAEEIARAQREVTLESGQDGANVRLHVEFPCEHGCCGDGDRHYTVRYEFRVQAPAGMALKLSTVNDGDVTVRGAFGDFVVNNVNGSIEMSDIAGSGEAHTVNGKVRVDFAKNPTGPSSFKSINGELRVSFQPGLSADVQLKTFNGEAWTDFDSTALPSEGGHWTGKRYARDRATGIRIGSGGPAINFDAFNGNIYILNRGKKS
jgi:hypothetical protein